MTKIQVLQQFFESFGIPAYPTNAVPKDTIFPWLTYEPIMSNYFGQNTVYPTVSLWYHSTSEKGINAKADEISKAIGNGITLTCDDGLIVIYFSGSWMPLNDEADSAIKRRQTTLQIEFNTL